MIRAAMIGIGQVAKSVPFDASTNGFAATSFNVQAALEEIKTKSFQPVEISATGSISPSGSSFETMTSMTVTPAAGTYLVMFSGSTLATTDSDGELAIFSGGSQITHSTRRVYSEASGLLGAVSAASMGSHTMALTTVNGSQAIEVKYRSTAGTITVTNRVLIYVRLFI